MHLIYKIIECILRERGREMINQTESKFGMDVEKRHTKNTV